MKIEKISIKNWRSIRDQVVKAQDLMVIIGQNNHGKSNLLSSILCWGHMCWGQVLLFAPIARHY